MPDYQTSEGMAMEPLVKDIEKQKKALKKIYKLCREKSRASVDTELLEDIEDTAEKALGLNRKHGFR